MKFISGHDFWVSLYKKSCKDKIPINSTFELTYNCNLNCGHCYVIKDKKKRELDFRGIIGLIDQLYVEGCISLTFTGGEIFTREDCLEILTYSHQKGFFIDIMTNATLIDQNIINGLKKIRIFKVNVSLYAMSREVFKKVCGIDLLNECLKGIKLLKDAGVPIKINTLVTKDNILELKEIEKFAKSINADFQADPNIQPSWDKGVTPTEKRVTKMEYINSCKYVFNGEQKKISYKKNKFCMNDEEPPLNNVNNNDSEKKNLFPCDVGKNSMVVDPYGSIYLCQNIPLPRFDTKTDGGLLNVWKKLVKYRAGLSPDSNFICGSCDLFDYCDWCPGCGFLEAGSVFECVPYYKELALMNKTKK